MADALAQQATVLARLANESGGAVQVAQLLGRLAAKLSNASNATGVLLQVLGLLDLAVPHAGRGASLELGAASALIDALASIADASDASSPTLGKRMLLMASAIADAMLGTLAVNGTANFSAGPLRMAMLKLPPQGDLGGVGIHVGGVSMPGVGLSASRRRRPAAVAGGCDAVGLLETTWQRGNAYFGSVVGAYPVAADWPVVVVQLRECGEDVDMDSAAGPCNISIPVRTASLGVGRRSCIRFNDSVGQWELAGAVVATEGDGSNETLMCASAMCTGAFSAVSDLEEPTMVPGAGELAGPDDSGKTASVTIASAIVSIVLVTGCCCCLARHRTALLQAASDAQGLTAILPRRFAGLPGRWQLSSPADKQDLESFGHPYGQGRGLVLRSRRDLVDAAFRELDLNGSGALSALEIWPLADLLGFQGPQEAWEFEYRAVCQYLQCDPDKGVDQAAFARLLDDQSSQGCFCSDAELRALLAILEHPGAVAEPPLAGLLSRVAPAVAREPHGTLELTIDDPFADADHRRHLLIDALFQQLGGGEPLLDGEMCHLANYVGFKGSIEEWAAEYKALCAYLGRGPGEGVDFQSFTQLLNDRSRSGCYCSNTDLCSLLQLLREDALPGLEATPRYPDFGDENFSL